MRSLEVKTNGGRGRPRTQRCCLQRCWEASISVEEKDHLVSASHTATLSLLCRIPAAAWREPRGECEPWKPFEVSSSRPFCFLKGLSMALLLLMHQFLPLRYGVNLASQGTLTSGEAAGVLRDPCTPQGPARWMEVVSSGKNVFMEGAGGGKHAHNYERPTEPEGWGVL